MSNNDVVPELKQILGAMIFGANRTLNLKELRKCLQEVAQSKGGETAAFGKVTEADVRTALDSLNADVKAARCGFHVTEVAGGLRLHNDASCGKWLRHLLNAGKPNRLSRPSLETLAIIAYRQPASRADIEAVRGVTVDHIIKSLLEMQLIKISGRSELPGRPFLYSTTHAFLEHFGLKDLTELSSMEPMLLAAREAQARVRRAQEPAGEKPPEEGKSEAEETEKSPEPGKMDEESKSKPVIEEEDDGEEEADEEEDEFDEDDDDDDDEDEDEDEDEK